MEFARAEADRLAAEARVAFWRSKLKPIATEQPTGSPPLDDAQRASISDLTRARARKQLAGSEGRTRP
jgi:hypothetical protein